MVYRDDRDALIARLDVSERELERLRLRVAELEAANQELTREVEDWRRRYPPPPPLSPPEPPPEIGEMLFQIVEPGGELREQRLAAAVIKIGKLSSSHVRLGDESVSRMHAVIEVSGDGVTIIDLGSSAGTLVNGERVNKETLKSGDLLQLGETRIRVYFG